MTEVAGNAGVLIAVATLEDTEASEPWTTSKDATAATAVAQVASLSDQGWREIVARGLAQTRHFDSTVALDRIEAIYSQLSSQKALFVQNTLSH